MNREQEENTKRQLFNFGKKAGSKTLKTANKTRKYIVNKIAKKLGLSIALVSFFSFIFISILIVLLLIIIGNNTDTSNDDFETGFELSAEVEAYSFTIELYAEQFGILEYVPLIKAIMQVESGGTGTDPMQCSECPFNDRYPQKPNSIEEAGYSIQVGCEYLAYCINQAGATGINDTEKIKLVAQGYNYGNGYITWALTNYGGYSQDNAIEFSNIKREELGWASYGDTQYVSKVFKYLTTSNTGNIHQDIVNIALNEVGNNYSKYGLASHWCAAFVSWCARQSNIPETEIQTYYSVWSGINWFKQQGRFKESSYRGGVYLPKSGDIVFINWNGILGNDSGNHTGIVVKVENGIVHTVEGNTNGYGNIFWNTSKVTQQSYPINSRYITGYGIYS